MLLTVQFQKSIYLNLRSVSLKILISCSTLLASVISILLVLENLGVYAMTI